MVFFPRASLCLVEPTVALGAAAPALEGRPAAHFPHPWTGRFRPPSPPAVGQARVPRVSSPPWGWESPGARRPAALQPSDICRWPSGFFLSENMMAPPFLPRPRALHRRPASPPLRQAPIFSPLFPRASTNALVSKGALALALVSMGVHATKTCSVEITSEETTRARACMPLETPSLTVTMGCAFTPPAAGH